jgi:hypothetical protein
MSVYYASANMIVNQIKDTIDQKTNSVAVSSSIQSALNCAQIGSLVSSTGVITSFKVLTGLSTLPLLLPLVQKATEYLLESPKISRTPTITEISAHQLSKVFFLANVASSIAIATLAFTTGASISFCVLSAANALFSIGDLYQKAFPHPSTNKSHKTAPAFSFFNHTKNPVNLDHLNEKVIALVELKPLDGQVNLDDFKNIWDYLEKDYLPELMQNDHDSGAVSTIKGTFLNVVNQINSGYRIRDSLAKGEPEKFLRTQKTMLQHILKNLQELVNPISDQYTPDFQTAAIALSQLAIAFKHCQTSVTDVIDRTARELSNGLGASRELTFKDEVLMILHNYRHQILESEIGRLVPSRETELVAIVKRFKKENAKEFGLQGQTLAEEFTCQYDHLGAFYEASTVKRRFFAKYNRENIIETIYQQLKEATLNPHKARAIHFTKAHHMLENKMKIANGDENYWDMDDETYTPIVSKEGVEKLLVHIGILSK